MSSTSSTAAATSAASICTFANAQAIIKKFDDLDNKAPVEGAPQPEPVEGAPEVKVEAQIVSHEGWTFSRVFHNGVVYVKLIGKSFQIYQIDEREQKYHDTVYKCGDRILLTHSTGNGTAGGFGTAENWTTKKAVLTPGKLSETFNGLDVSDAYEIYEFITGIRSFKEPQMDESQYNSTLTSLKEIVSFLKTIN